jgi:anti-sigma regulatory factor (Ser/Thr protein kinase)
VRNRLSALPVVLGQLEGALRGTGATAEEGAELRLMAEEALTNIVKYAFEDAQEHVIEVALRIAPDETTLRFRDDGRPFDPLGHPLPDQSSPAEEPPVGGLGLFLLRTLADTASYRRSEGCNILSLTKRLPGRAAAGQAGKREKE